RALELCPTYIDIRARLAGAHRDAGQREEAIREYEEIVRQNPTYIPARLSLGLVLQAVGRVEEAVRQWDAVLQIAPGNRNAEIYLKLAEGEPRGAPPGGR
ncbi:MAG: tetratricopeptide repeat protein, partial [Anaeromyxobacteraceae bacterium]